VAALLGRQRGTLDEAVHLDVSMVDGVASWMGRAVASAFAGEQTPTRGDGLLSGGAPYYAIYETADGRYMALGALEPKFWATFCTVAGRPEWTERQHETPPDRLAADLRALFASRTQAAWAETIGDADACCTPILDWDEVWDDPHIEARRLLTHVSERFTTIRHPVLWNGEAPGPGPDA
jgi:crotonobetainyl-CoA:carnitine CoA-transferase CaiB-like acyl-CoA transferase